MICKYGTKTTRNWEEAKIDAERNGIKKIEVVKDTEILIFQYDENRRMWKIVK